MDDFIIRKATLDDLKEVQRLNLELFKKEHKEFDESLNLEWTHSETGTDYYKKRISEDNGFVAVALSDGKIIGYICGALENAEDYRVMGEVAELENMYVEDNLRSKGVGSELYGEFLKWCRSKNVGKIKVEATSQNTKAIEFYRKNGFKDYTLVLEHDL